MHYLKSLESDTYISNNPEEVLTNFGANQTLAIDNSRVHNVEIVDIKSIRRSLVRVDLDDINDIVPSDKLSSAKFVLRMIPTDELNLPTKYKIYAYPLSQSWEQGKGMYAYDGDISGVNWVYTNYPDTSSTWFPNINLSYVPADDYLNVPTTSSFMRGGGTWYYQCPVDYSSSIFQISSGSSFRTTQSFSYQKSNIELDITTICMSWIFGVIPNNGLILMSSTELDSTSCDNGELQFFGKDTNTIYQPVVDIEYDDSLFLTSSFITGSLTGSIPPSPVTSSAGVYVTLNNVNREYKLGSIIRFTIFARDLYPAKTFDRLQNVYLNSKFLPSSSYYSIVDNDTNEKIIPFDDYSKISCVSGSNYFMVDTNCFQVERYYKILIKSVLDDGSVNIYDNNSVFKLVK